MTRSVFSGDDPNRAAGELHRKIVETTEFNPWRALPFGTKGSEATHFSPDQTPNLRWQSRVRPPTVYEDGLAEALGEIFTAGHWELPDIVAQLNARMIRTPQGEAWSEANFERVLSELERGL